MSLDNAFGLNAGWKIDPDNRQDRSDGPCITRMMTDEEIKKYGIKESEGTNMKPMNLDENKVMDICREHGTGKEGAVAVADTFGIKLKQAENQIFNMKIRRRLAAEENTEPATEIRGTEETMQGLPAAGEQLSGSDLPPVMTAEKISAINSHEDHPDPENIPQQPVETEEYTNIIEAAGEALKEFNKVATDSMNRIRLTNTVNEMLEMLPDPEIDHPVHYTDGKIESIDFIQDKLTPEEFEGFCKGTVLQYVIRCRLKGGVKDLKKAEWYLKRLISVKESA